MVSIGKVVQLTSTKQMAAMGKTMQSASTMQMVAMGKTMQSGQTGQYDPSAQPILPLLMMQCPHSPAQSASQIQTVGQASGRTYQYVLSENRKLHEENQKLLGENSILKIANGFFMKRAQELKLKVKELRLKLKGKVCILDEMFYI